MVRIIDSGSRHTWNQNPVLLTGQVNLGMTFLFLSPSFSCKILGGGCDTCLSRLWRELRDAKCKSCLRPTASPQEMEVIFNAKSAAHWFSQCLCAQAPICSGLPRMQGCHWHPDFCGTIPRKACGDCGVKLSREAALCAPPPPFQGGWDWR